MGNDENARLRNTIVEITQENIDLYRRHPSRKKKEFQIEDKKRYSGEEKQMILDYINRTINRSHIKLDWVLNQLGIASITYYHWRKKEAAGDLEDKPSIAPNLDTVLPWEEEAVVNYALEHTKEGYRRLSYMMPDDDVVYLSPSSVYRDKDLLYRYKRSSKSPGKYNFTPTEPHEQWHTDILYFPIDFAQGDVYLQRIAQRSCN